MITEGLPLYAETDFYMKLINDNLRLTVGLKELLDNGEDKSAGQLQVH